MGNTPPQSLPSNVTGQYIESFWDDNGRQRVFHRRYANSDTETTTWDTDERDDNGNVIKKIETRHHNPQHPTDFSLIWKDILVLNHPDRPTPQSSCSKPKTTVITKKNLRKHFLFLNSSALHPLTKDMLVMLKTALPQRRIAMLYHYSTTNST